MQFVGLEFEALNPVMFLLNIPLMSGVRRWRNAEGKKLLSGASCRSIYLLTLACHGKARISAVFSLV